MGRYMLDFFRNPVAKKSLEMTTEFVRCPDPTSNLVAKIIRTKVG